MSESFDTAQDVPLISLVMIVKNEAGDSARDVGTGAADRG